MGPLSRGSRSTIGLEGSVFLGVGFSGASFDFLVVSAALVFGGGGGGAGSAVGVLFPEVGGDCPRESPTSMVGDVTMERGVSILEGIVIRGEGGLGLEGAAG